IINVTAAPWLRFCGWNTLTICKALDYSQRRMHMIVSAHQPNFMPWLGFFDKMRKADLFVLVDHVQFERQNYQNRTRIKTGEGPRWLTVPVNQRSRNELILEKTIDNSRDGRLRWGRQ